MRAIVEVDVRPALPLIQAPTLVLHRRDAQYIPIEHGRYLAEHIPKARFVELPGADPTLIWETPELALDHIEAFLTGVRRIAPPKRILATVLFKAFGGQLIKTTGDGMLTTFDGPGRAIRCAAALRDELGGIGVQIGAGLHSGEVELRDGDVGGIAVHLAARVLAAAQPGGHPGLQDRPRPDGGLRHYPAGPWHPPPEGRGGHLAAVLGKAALGRRPGQAGVS